MLWWIVAATMELLSFGAGFHDLQMAYIVSREDIESLTKKEWKMTRRMEYADLKAYLSKRFPNSIPDIASEKEEHLLSAI